MYQGSYDLKKGAVFAACVYPNITVFDYLSPFGTPYCKWTPGGTITPFATPNPLYDCTGFIFGTSSGNVPCDYYSGDLYLVFLQQQSEIGPMRMGEGLGIIGMNNLTFINGSLFIINAFSLAAVDTTSFLPKLRSVAGGLTALDYGPYFQKPALFVSLPLQSVRYAGVLTLLSTGLTSMGSFAGLRCTQGLRLSNNTALNSLSGLEGLQYIDPLNQLGVGSLKIDTCPLLNSPDKFRPLSRVAQCGSAAPPNVINITIPSCPVSLTSFPQLCNYIASTVACP
jgi:hypothetical protein